MRLGRAAGVLGGGLLLAAAGLRAQEPDLDSLQALLDRPVQVSSLGLREGLLDTPSAVTVLDRETLRRFNVATVDEALELAAGVMVVDAKRNITTIRGVLQENYASKVLVLVDGEPTWMASTGEGAPFRVDLDSVERIEILRGPASVLYGTNAYAGTVNLVLRKAPGAEATAGLADKGGSRLGAYGAGAAPGGMRWSASAHRTRDTGRMDDFVGEDHRPAPGREFEDSDQVTAGLGLGPHALTFNRFRFAELFLGTSFTGASAAGGDHVSEGRLLAYRFQRELRPGWELGFDAAQDWNGRDFMVAPGNARRTRVEGERRHAKLRSGHRLGALSLDWGADLDLRRSRAYESYLPSTGAVVSRNNLTDRGLREGSVYAQAQWRRGAWTLLAGARRTRNERFGGNLSHRLALVHGSGSRSFKLIWGQSFRAPTLFELYFQSAPSANTTYGNPGLRPETSSSLEGVYAQSFGATFLQATLYRATYADKIFRTRRYPQYVQNPADFSTLYVNGSAFHATGLELEALHQGRRLNAFFNGSWIHGDRGDEVPGSGHYNFKYDPAWTLAGGLQLPLGPLAASAVVRRTGPSSGALGPIPGATLADLGLNLEHRAGPVGLRHALTLKDAGDVQASFGEYNRRNLNELPTGLGRRVAYTLRATF